MNLGLGNRTELKAQLLPDAIRARTDWDAIIDAIGLGVAASFERYCNRKLARTENDIYTCDAGRRTFVLPRYPVESIASVEIQDDGAATWTTLSDVLQYLDPVSGLVVLASEQGNATQLIRFTYTGGYWFDTTEDGTGTQPEGSTARPADLKLAWLLHAAAVWGAVDTKGAALSQPAATPPVAQIAFAPFVLDILRAYRRHTIL